MATKRRVHKRAKARESAIAGGRAIIGKLLPAGPQCLDRDLDAAIEAYHLDGGRWRAFEAVSLIAAKRMAESTESSADFDGIEPTESVPVPW